jgi:glutaminase
MATSLIRSDLDQSKRFRFIMDQWHAVSGRQKLIGFSNSSYLADRASASADRNYCLCYMMQEANAFAAGRDKHAPPRKWGEHDLEKHLDLYFQCCNIETNTDGVAVIAATLANGGLCPLTGERCFKTENVRKCLSLMLSCGLYDYSGEWAYKIGLPAKSGSSGCMLVVIPNVGGLALYAPRLDAFGNSQRGIEFCSRLASKFSFHYYDYVHGIVSSRSGKVNPTIARNLTTQNELIQLCYLCARGDLNGIRTALAAGADVNGRDYDQRTPLHLAAAEGQLAVVKYLVAKGADLGAVDRWGGTPYADAVREGHKIVAEYLHKKARTLKEEIASRAAAAAAAAAAAEALAATHAHAHYPFNPTPTEIPTDDKPAL